MREIFIVLIFITTACKVLTVVNSQTYLDFKFGPLVKLTRLFFSDLIRPKPFEAGYRESVKINRVQPKFEGDFFCEVNHSGARSQSVPTSVHRLTPGDIDIVGALGDSLTAANGAFAVNGLQTLLEGRGVSWSIGGFNDWRKFLTLPNIIKQFNQELYGFPQTENSLGFEKSSKFNVAEPGAISIHTIRQAKNLVKRMRIDPRVDIKKHWKLITLMIGSNDFCLDICYYENQEKVIEDAEKNMIHVLRILRENLPRLLVNVVIPVDVGIIFSFKDIPKVCKGFHYAECPCLVSLNQHKKIHKTLNTIKLWKEMIVRVTNRQEFHERDDFEVNLMKFTKDLKLPVLDGNKTDYSYLSQDCFHLSQKGHSIFALNLWNQMLTSDNERKSDASFNYGDFKCPSVSHPYFRTGKN